MCARWQYDGRDLREHMTSESTLEMCSHLRVCMTDAESMQVGKHFKSVDKCRENLLYMVASQRNGHSAGNRVPRVQYENGCG